jgi:excinuclease UvrABC helicase subunit UvrB
LPVAEVILCVVEDLAGLVTVGIRGAGVTRDNRTIIEKMQEATTVLGENDLLLSALNSSSKFGLVCFLKLLAGL